MTQIKPKTIVCFDWNEVEAEVERIAGKPVRDWGGKFHPSFDETKPYLDFWHKMLEYHTNISNGCLVDIDFLDVIDYYSESPDTDWVVDILKIFHAVVGRDEATFHIHW